MIDVSPLYKYVVAGRVRRAARPGRDARHLPRRDRPGDLHPVVRRGGQGHRRRHHHAAGRPIASASRPPIPYRWFAMNATGLDVRIDDISETTAALALQGRLSRQVLERATGQDWSDSATSAGARPRSRVSTSTSRGRIHGRPRLRAVDPRGGGARLWDRLFEVGADYGLRPAGSRHSTSAASRPA